jgi:hypothetical protein
MPCTLGAYPFFAVDRLVRARRRAVERACLERAFGEAAARLSRLSARVVARERLGDAGRCSPVSAFSYSRAAWRRVLSDTVPGRGGASFTPARRALESPMAIACLVERAPCLPSRMCRISSCTNSPAWVEGDLPSFLSLRARRMVSFSGITSYVRGLRPEMVASSEGLVHPLS